MTLANTKDKSRILSYKKFPEKKSLPKKDSLPEKDNRPRVPIKPKISSKKIEVKSKESSKKIEIKPKKSSKKLVVVKSNSNSNPSPKGGDSPSASEVEDESESVESVDLTFEEEKTDKKKLLMRGMSFEGKAKMEKQKKLAKAQLTQKQSTAAHFIEKDFKHKETVLIGDDVYSLTIAANMTGRCPPTQVLFCIR